MGYAEKCKCQSQGHGFRHGNRHGNFYDRVDSLGGCDSAGCDSASCDGGCAAIGGCDSPGFDTSAYAVSYQQPSQSMPGNAFQVTQPQIAQPQYIMPAERPQPYTQPYSINAPTPAATPIRPAESVTPQAPVTPRAPVEVAPKPAPPVKPATQMAPKEPMMPTPDPSTNKLQLPEIPRPKTTPILGTPKIPELNLTPHDARFAPKTQAMLASELVEAQKRPIRPLPPAQNRQMRVSAAPRQTAPIQAPNFIIQPTGYAPGSVGSVSVPPPLTPDEYFASSATQSNHWAKQQSRPDQTRINERSQENDRSTREETAAKSPYAGQPYDVPKKKSLMPSIPSWRFIKQP